MKTVKEFAEKLVTIDFVEQSNCYGHYPFQLFVEKENGEFVMCALALGGDVNSCYQNVKKYKNEKANRIYLSLDFPAVLDMENDFVMIFSLENKKIETFAIPYNVETGEKLDIVKEGNFLTNILSDFKKVVGLQ